MPSKWLAAFRQIENGPLLALETCADSAKSAHSTAPSLERPSNDTKEPSNGTNGSIGPGEVSPKPCNVRDSANTYTQQKDLGERAAIVQHDGYIPREWAEGFARLDPKQSPADVPLKRWQRFVDDVGLFLDSPFSAVAVALGWGPFDLFGCDRDRPFARIDQSGLLWLINGEKLVALSEDAAGIETGTGERHTYRRKPSAPGRVLAWELAS